MGCAFFEDDGIPQCLAIEGQVTPSVHERERFCLGDPERCRTLHARRRLGEALPEELYYALWLPVVEEQVDGTNRCVARARGAVEAVPEVHIPVAG